MGIPRLYREVHAAALHTQRRADAVRDLCFCTGSVLISRGEGIGGLACVVADVDLIKVGRHLQHGDDLRVGIDIGFVFVPYHRTVVVIVDGNQNRAARVKIIVTFAFVSRRRDDDHWCAVIAACRAICAERVFCIVFAGQYAEFVIYGSVKIFGVFLFTDVEGKLLPAHLVFVKIARGDRCEKIRLRIVTTVSEILGSHLGFKLAAAVCIQRAADEHEFSAGVAVDGDALHPHLLPAGVIFYKTVLGPAVGVQLVILDGGGGIRAVCAAYEGRSLLSVML